MRYQYCAKVPREARGHYLGLTATDNAPDARKESQLEHKKLMLMLQEDNLHEYTKMNGVDRLPIWNGDDFHIQALIDKHFSIGSSGDTKKGKHDQTHHRQVSNVMQQKYLISIYCTLTIYIISYSRLFKSSGTSTLERNLY